MQTPPLTYPRLPVAVTHAVTLGARTGWHDLVQLSQYQPTGHHGWAPLTATEPVVSAIADIDARAKTNTATAARRRNHCFIADPLLLSIQTFRLPRHLSMTTETIPGWWSGAGSALPGVRLRLMPVAALGPDEAGRGSRQAACGVDGGEDRQQDQHDEYRQPVGAVVVDVPPDDGEQHRAEEKHRVTPVALVGRGFLTKPRAWAYSRNASLSRGSVACAYSTIAEMSEV